MQFVSIEGKQVEAPAIRVYDAGASTCLFSARLYLPYWGTQEERPFYTSLTESLRLLELLVNN